MLLSPGKAWYPSMRRVSRSRPNLAHHDRHVTLRLWAPTFSRSSVVKPAFRRTLRKAAANSGVRYATSSQPRSTPKAGVKESLADAETPAA